MMPIHHITFLVVLGLTALVPFEDFLLKFLPVPDAVYLYLRFTTEGLIYLLLVITFLRKYARKQGWTSTPLDWPLASLLGIALLSAFINQSSSVGALETIRPLFRYVALYYVIVNLDLNYGQIKQVLKALLGACSVQLGFGVLQLISRGALDGFLQPRVVTNEILGVRKQFVLVESGREIGSIYGAAGDTILYAFTMVLFMALLLTVVRFRPQLKLKIWMVVVLIPLIFLTTSLTYVRVALLALVLLFGIYILSYLGPKGKAVMLSGTLLGLLCLPWIASFEYGGNARFGEQNPLADLTGVFTSDYFEQAKQQRLGALTGIVPTVLIHRPILGFGPDQLQTLDSLNTIRNDFLLKVWKKQDFNDVYWVALFAYFGIAGTLCLVFIFGKLWWVAQQQIRASSHPLSKTVSHTMAQLVLTTGLLMFINQALVFRAYSYYFWLLAGLMITLHLQQRSVEQVE